MNTTINTIGKNVRALRRQRNWNQRQVALQLDISVPAFSKIETGSTDINISRLNQIAALFNVNVLDILSVHGEHSLSISIKELDECKTELLEARQEILRLQTRLICLYDENSALVHQVKRTLQPL
jgi:transcriptional regulator with XRE-family HTH domain